jgi:hypothetical protein
MKEHDMYDLVVYSHAEIAAIGAFLYEQGEMGGFVLSDGNRDEEKQEA